MYDLVKNKNQIVKMSEYLLVEGGKVDVVDRDDGVLNLGLIVVGVCLGAHTEWVGLEAGVTEYCVVSRY